VGVIQVWNDARNWLAIRNDQATDIQAVCYRLAGSNIPAQNDLLLLSISILRDGNYQRLRRAVFKRAAAILHIGTSRQRRPGIVYEDHLLFRVSVRARISP